MKTANIGELKNNLSKYLAEVKRGGQVLVSDRNVPFAKIVSLDENDVHESEEELLIAEGILSRPKSSKPLDDSFWDDRDLPSVPMDVILRVIREERDED